MAIQSAVAYSEAEDETIHQQPCLFYQHPQADLAPQPRHILLSVHGVETRGSVLINASFPFSFKYFA